MDKQSLKTTLEVSTNLAVLLVAIAVLSILAMFFFAKSTAPELTPGLERGKVLGSLSNVDYKSSEQTLLIALTTTCSYCRESLPLYRKVLDAQHQATKSLRIIALFPNSAQEVAAYLKENQLTVDTVTGVDFGSLHISGTPTMILVNDRAEVKDFWTGRLENREADEFLRSLIAEKRNLQ